MSVSDRTTSRLETLARSRGGAVLGVSLVVLLAFLFTGRLAPRGLPFGVVLLGLLIGALNSLVALGLVLVYRAGKYVNFAQGGIGAAGAVIAGKLIVVNGVPYVLAVGSGIAASVLLAGLVEILFVRRLFKAPRLILTVATIGIAQLFGAFEVGVNAFWRDDTQIQPRIDFPLDLQVSVGGVLFRGEHLVVLAVFPLVVGGLFLFLRSTAFGVAVQASAENADRARLLGISVRRVSTAVWMIAGLLAGITAVLQAPIVGFSFGAAAGPGLLLRALAPAMIAGLTGLWGTVAAALALGVFEQALVWNFDSAGPVDAALFVVILVALLVRRRRASRTTEGEESSFAASTRIRPFPRELAGIRSVRAGRLLLRSVLLFAVVALPSVLSISQRNLASLLLIYMIAALSLTVLSGFAGQISFGHWAFVGFGALFGGWLVVGQGIHPLFGGVIVCAGGVVLSLAIGLPALRIRGLFLAVATLAFAVAAASYLFTLPIFRFTGVAIRPVVLGIDFDKELAYYYVCLGALLCSIVLVRRVRAGRWGRAFIAVRDNDRAAASYGVKPTAAKLMAFAVSGFLAALAGYLYLFNQQSLNEGAFPVETSLLLFSAVVIGGLGSIPGAIIGALYLRGIQFFAPSLQLLSTSFGLLLVLMFAPGGIGGLAFQGRDALLRWLANRWGIVVPSLLADRRVDDAGLPPASSEPAPAEATRHLEEVAP